MFSQIKTIFTNQFYTERSSIFSGIFLALLFLFGQKPLLAAATAVAYQGEKNILLGITIFSFVLLEIWAYRIKMKTIEGDVSRSDGFVMFAWIFHMLASIIMVILAYVAFKGGGTVNMDSQDNWFGVLVLFEVIRNLILLANMSPAKQKFIIPLSQRILADLVITIFNFLILVTTWQAISFNAPTLNEGGIGLTIFNTVLALIIFMIFFIPLNLFNFISFYAKKRSLNEEIIFYFSLLVIIYLALAALYK
jgi:hypothetical protein